MVHTNIMEGTLNVHPGDTVEEGQVLVTGVTGKMCIRDRGGHGSAVKPPLSKGRCHGYKP